MGPVLFSKGDGFATIKESLKLSAFLDFAIFEKCYLLQYSTKTKQKQTKQTTTATTKNLSILDSREGAMNSLECSGQSKSMTYVNSLL